MYFCGRTNKCKEKMNLSVADLVGLGIGGSCIFNGKTLGGLGILNAKMLEGGNYLLERDYTYNYAHVR
jgi:hypothetical protein